MTNLREITARFGGWIRPLVLAAAATAVYLAPAIENPFYTKGEAREAVLVQAMRDGGNYVLPLRNGNELPSKPPLFHWLAAAAATFSGEVSELSMRVPSVAAAALVIGVTTWLGALMFSASAGWVAAIVLGSSVAFFVAATSARVDMVLAAAITLALASFHYDCSGRRNGLGHGFHGAVAAAVLAKGPIGLVVPWAVVCGFLVATRDRDYARSLRPLRAAAWLALPAAWYVCAYALAGKAFLAKQLLQENFQRLLDAEGGATGHVKPFYAHLPLLLGGLAPWSLMWTAACAYASRECLNVRSRSLLFLLMWLAVPLTMLSFAGSKRAVYMLPSYPACALLVGWWWTQPQGWTHDSIARAECWWRRIATATGAVLGAALVVLLVQAIGIPVDRAIAIFLSAGDRANLAAVVDSLARARGLVAGAASLGLLVVVAFIAVIQQGRRDYAAAVVGVFAAVAIAGGSVTLQRAIASTQSVKPFVQAVRARANPVAEWAFFRDVSYPVAFYAKRAVPRVDALKALDPARPAIVFATAGNAPELLTASDAIGRVATEAGRFTYGDNPEREPLVVFALSPAGSVGSPGAGR